jgi:hypothetical protein
VPRVRKSSTPQVSKDARRTLRKQKKRPSKSTPMNPASESKRRSHKRATLPPNEEVKKYPDEIYGDTEIPASERRR